MKYTWRSNRAGYDIQVYGDWTVFPRKDKRRVKQQASSVAWLRGIVWVERHMLILIYKDKIRADVTERKSTYTQNNRD